METGMILALMILTPVVLSIAALLWVPEEWLQRFGELVRSLVVLG